MLNNKVFVVIITQGEGTDRWQESGVWIGSSGKEILDEVLLSFEENFPGEISVAEIDTEDYGPQRVFHYTTMGGMLI